MTRSAEEGSSSEYRIFETDELARSLKRLASSDAAFLAGKLRSHVYPQLRANPYLGPHIRKLRGYKPPTWRYRVGRYRVFYLVDDGPGIVFILTVDDRKDAYR